MPGKRTPSEAGDKGLYWLSARSWEAKFASGDHYATDKPFAGLAAVIEELRRRSPHRLLDVGCGDGRNIGLLSQAADVVVGIDRAEVGLRRALRRPVAPHCSIGLVRGDMGNLPFRAASLDAVVNVWVMNHGTHDDINRYIAEMDRVLRSGGLLFASVSAWSLPIAVGMAFFGRKVADPSPDGHTYLVRFKTEQGIHHFFTRREMISYFSAWRIVRLRRERYRAEAPVRLVFWNILAEKP